MSTSRPVRESAALSGDDVRSQPSRAIKRIGIVLYDGFSLLAAGILAEALHTANELQSEDSKHAFTYRVNLISASGGTVSCSSAMSVWTQPWDGDDVDSLDTLFVAGGSGVARALADDAFVELLRRLSAKSDSIIAIGNGHILLSAAGVQQRDSQSLKHDSDQALMSSLTLLKKDLGSEIAARVAHRLGSSADISLESDLEEMHTATLREKVCASARWITQNCAKPISIVDAARMSSMSERNFLRLFKREIGITPLQYLLRARLDLTCKLLKSTDLPVDKIARRAGLSNGERLSKLFRKELSMSPSEFRAQSRNRE
ncbi:AraC family transcriptional regulator [Caballeronia temeraria]|uniref:AraC family transcriptional regulator n=1 Tax=Caballeronia temeraria TaxID=1777137 RepID=A0A157ZVM4_9BURK|nr:helix-turn-helix domain-containing protein [Caballeronia temeraria]SAK49588.1 AraC family transcriptional regulator [Caballeronia temeraria]